MRNSPVQTLTSHKRYQARKEKRKRKAAKHTDRLEAKIPFGYRLEHRADSSINRHDRPPIVSNPSNLSKTLFRNWPRLGFRCKNFAGATPPSIFHAFPSSGVTRPTVSMNLQLSLIHLPCTYTRTYVQACSQSRINPRKYYARPHSDEHFRSRRVGRSSE